MNKNSKASYRLFSAILKILIKEGFLQFGNDTGFFGPITESAVKQFQIQQGILSANSSDLGLVGPKTRAKLNEITGSGTGVPAPSAEEAKQQHIRSLQEQLISLLIQLQALLQQPVELKKAGGN